MQHLRRHSRRSVPVMSVGTVPGSATPRSRGRPPGMRGRRRAGGGRRREQEESRADEEEGRSPPLCQVKSGKQSQTGKEHLVNTRSTRHSDITDQSMDGKGTQYRGLRGSSRKLEPEEELTDKSTRSVCMLEQKRKVVSSNIDVPQVRRYEDELDMDKVTAAMVLTSLSTSPLIRSPSVQHNADLTGSWKEGECAPSSSSSSGYWSWSNASDYSNPSTPSPPLSADGFKYFRCMAHVEDDAADGTDNSNLHFEDPVPRKRKNSMKVMFKCLWKKCGKVLSTAAGIKKHIRTVHLGRSGELDDCDGEEDFYYTEIRLNKDSGPDGLYSLSAVSPTYASAPATIFHPNAGGYEGICAKTDTRLNSRLSRSAPNTFYLVNSDHAYQATPSMNIPSSRRLNASNFGVSRLLPQTNFNGTSVCLPCSRKSGKEHSQPLQTVFTPPRAAGVTRKPRGEGKKCRKVYGMENRDKWCTACRWKKACQRFPD